MILKSGKMYRVELCTELFYAIIPIPSLLFAHLLSLHLLTLEVLFSNTSGTEEFILHVLWKKISVGGLYVHLTVLCDHPYLVS